MGNLCSNRPLVLETQANPSKLVTQFSKLTSLKEKFEFISQIGNGAFGKVRLYRDIYYKNMLYAIKTLKKEGIPQQLYKCLKAEVQILSELDHPNIVKYYGTFEDLYHLHIVMEYLKGDNLNKIIILKDYNELDEEEMCQIIYQLLKALLFIHNKNIVHRDIKPENIVFGKKSDYSTLKLIDFGLATNTKNTKKNSCGSPYYMAPEIIEGNFSKKTDIWSVGVIVYLMFTGKHPYTTGKDGKEDLFENILKKNYNVAILNNSEYSEEGKDFVLKTLVKNENERMSTEECLEHPWIKNYLSNKDNSKLITANLVKVLISFGKKSLLQKELLYFISKITHEDEIKRQKEIFNYIDIHNEGTIRAEEIKIAFESNGIQVSEDEINKIWNALNFHRDGKVTYSEFLAGILPIKLFEDEEKLSELFNYFIESVEDKQAITFKLLVNKATVLGIKLNEKELKVEFEKLEKEKGTKVTFDVFKELLTKRDS